jgi:hypothetical protein
MAIFRQKSLDKLSSPEQLDKLIEITSPLTWLTLIGAGLIVGTTVVWSVISKIPTTMPAAGLYTTTNTSKAEAVFYVPFAESKKIEKGMPVNVYFSSLSKDSYGHVEAKVSSVSNKPATAQEMAKDLKDATLANYFMSQTQSGPVVSVKVALNKDSRTKSGLDWSTVKGDKAIVRNNTMLTADIITNEATPFSKVFPNFA